MSRSTTTGGSLVVEDLTVSYGRGGQVVQQVSLSVQPGEIVAVLGSNGAGKTSVLRAVSGLLRYHRGKIDSGTITLDGRDIAGQSSSKISSLGLGQVPEGRRIFSTLSVEENLLVTGGRFGRSGGDGGEALKRVYDMFPVLADRRRGVAGLLSGGEQQMLALGRALMGRPTLLCIDELSLGLAPQIVQMAIERLVELNRTEGLSVLLIEQNARLALRHAHRAYVLDVGRVTLSGTASNLLDAPELIGAYLGGAS